MAFCRNVCNFSQWGSLLALDAWEWQPASLVAGFGFNGQLAFERNSYAPAVEDHRTQIRSLHAVRATAACASRRQESRQAFVQNRRTLRWKPDARSSGLRNRSECYYGL